MFQSAIAGVSVAWLLVDGDRANLAAGQRPFNCCYPRELPRNARRLRMLLDSLQLHTAEYTTAREPRAAKTQTNVDLARAVAPLF